MPIPKESVAMPKYAVFIMVSHIFFLSPPDMLNRYFLLFFMQIFLGRRNDFRGLFRGVAFMMMLCRIYLHSSLCSMQK